MDLHLRFHHPLPVPDWPAAAAAGFAAGAVMMLLEMFWSALASDTSPWVVSHMIAAIVMGPATLQSAEFNLEIVAMALAAHYLLGILFGLLLAAILVPFRLDSSLGMAALVGAVFGSALYLLNFYAMTYFFPWFVEWRGMQTLLAHLIFGETAALLYVELNRQH